MILTCDRHEGFIVSYEALSHERESLRVSFEMEDTPRSWRALAKMLGVEIG